MNWCSRKVLSWRLFNTMEVGFCIETLEEALRINAALEIVNTDQGAQFTRFEFTNVLKENGIKISMDDKGRWMDKVFIERLWRSLKYECVYLNAIENGSQARKEVTTWLSFYNHKRPHSTFDGLTSAEVYDPVADIDGVPPQYLQQAA